MTETTQFPVTFDVRIRAPYEGKMRFYSLSLHVATPGDALDEIIALFPGLDVSRARDLILGRVKPGVGINGDVAIMNADNYSGKGPRRKSPWECIASLTECLSNVVADLHAVTSRIQQSKDDGARFPLPAYEGARAKLNAWAIRLSQKVLHETGELLQPRVPARRRVTEFNSSGIDAPGKGAPPPQWPAPPTEPVPVMIRPVRPVEEVYLLPEALRPKPATPVDDSDDWGVPKSLRDIKM